MNYVQIEKSTRALRSAFFLVGQVAGNGSGRFSFLKKSLTTMHRTTILFLLAGLLQFAACVDPARPHTPESMIQYFRRVAGADTLVFEVEQDDEYAEAANDTIPNALFFSVLDSALLAEISHVADSATAVVLARQRFPLTNEVEACLVDIRQFWFQHQSLLLFDRRKNAFTSRVTVAEWYGGDGGQVLTGSWLVDHDGDGQRDLVRREIQHTLRPDDKGEAIDETHESAMLLAWREGRFVEQPLSDTMLVVKRYPIRSFW